MALPIILGTAFEIEYQVLEGGDLDIDFQMSSPSGTLLFNELRSEEGLHEIRSICNHLRLMCWNLTNVAEMDNIYKKITFLQVIDARTEMKFFF